MTKKENHYLYALTFDANPQPVVFYVGHTNNPKRRETEHRAAVRDTANTEYKYQWCRQLEAVGVKWDFVVLGEIEDDEDAEYEWVLKFARDNKSKDIAFIDDLPLTNMKAGDFLHEILDRPEIRTKKQIKQYREERKQRATDYERDNDQSWNYVPTAKGEMFKEYVQALGEEHAAVSEQERQRAAEKAKKYMDMLNSPERQQRIREETERLMREDDEAQRP